MDFNPRGLLAGIGLLIFSMGVFDQALKTLGSEKVKQILEKYTHNRWASMLTGFTTTSLLNSSTLVTLLTIAFVGAGAMQLYNAIGVILGANIGSATRSVVIAIFGFGEFKISAFALPLLAIGGCSLMFPLKEKYKMIAQFVIGFGLLFLAINFMKESVEALQTNFDLAKYKDVSLWAFGLIGMVTTAILHSSGALGIMTLAALDGGIISFPASVAINMGANIGTTFTAIYASLGGKKTKRQVAMSHVLFNLLSSVIGVGLFRQYIWLTNDLLGLGHTPVIANAVLNFIFNLTTAVLFCLFLKSYTRLIERIVPNNPELKEQHLHIEILNNIHGEQKFIGPALIALAEDRKILINQTIKYTGFIFGITPSIVQTKLFDPDTIDKDALQSRDKQEHIRMYDLVKTSADKMLSLVLHLKSHKMDTKTVAELHAVETTIYSCLKAAKAIKNIHRDIIDIRGNIDPYAKKIYDSIMLSGLKTSRHLFHVASTKGKAAYEELLLALKEIKHTHTGLLKEISGYSQENIKKIPSITTLVNIDHYVYESNEMMLLAYANTYLSITESTLFEQTEDVDEEIYESFSVK